MSKPQVIVIVGPTSSGKTSLSIEIAKKINGEVISADSRQVYRGLDIGTGKVTKEEMGGIPHHLLDIVDPSQTYTVTDFVKDGDAAIHTILKNEHVPIIAGGTFLYIDALLGRTSTPMVPPNEELRIQLESRTAEELFQMLLKLDSSRAESIDKNNKRRLIRAIEICTAIGKVPKIEIDRKYDYLIFGIKISKEDLQKNIHTRLEERLENGMIDETTNLLEEGVTNKRLQELGIEYKYISLFLQGTIDFKTMKQEVETKSWQYAKRQLTWLKRDEEIHWVNSDDIDTVYEKIKSFIKIN